MRRTKEALFHARAEKEEKEAPDTAPSAAIFPTRARQAPPQCGCAAREKEERREAASRGRRRKLHYKASAGLKNARAASASPEEPAAAPLPLAPVPPSFPAGGPAVSNGFTGLPCSGGEGEPPAPAPLPPPPRGNPGCDHPGVGVRLRYLLLTRVSRRLLT
ncbi:Hypothetical predicted protein [Podarcis lilfordi]|uniref:Uncharacterized protein n=1 Tax=Podarcis lilfordi TaxID=74358 RepID=A0AA35P657_9SAUR|nr:Hypothetical predicted protein [Podarcis lilfordi]